MAKAKIVNRRAVTNGDAYIGERIKEARLAVKMSQDQLGTRLGVSFQQVQKYERGTNRVSGGRITQIAAALDKPLEFFFQTGGDVRTKANPLLTQFIATKEGLVIASSWYRLAPAVRGRMLGLFEILAKEGA